MRALLENPLWHKALMERKRQRVIGAASGVFLTIALLAMLDGLIAQMREGDQLLQLLPGQAVTISGPVRFQNPLERDLVARFTPENAPLEFRLEGFFSGYWFGNGMWRGTITAAEKADAGDFDLRISFLGAPASTTQIYKIEIFSDAMALRAASPSLLRRFTGLNPFLMAAWTGVCGVLLGIVTYIFGRRYNDLLTRLGLSEICASDPRNSLIWCIIPKDMCPHFGLDRMVLDANGHVVAEARTLEWKKGRLQLALLDINAPPPRALICLRHPCEPAHAKSS